MEPEELYSLCSYVSSPPPLPLRVKGKSPPKSVLLPLLISSGLLTVFLALLILYFDFPLPDELKGFIFFAQVIGVIYRNTPYLLGNSGGGVSVLLSVGY